MKPALRSIRATGNHTGSKTQQTYADAKFVSGGEFGVGVEEELLLVDAEDQLTDGPTDSLVRALQLSRQGTVCRELFGAEIEFATTIGCDGDEVSSALREFRAGLQRAGGRAMAVGVHPAGGFSDVRLTESPRYNLIGSSLAGVLRTPTAALQVHVGMPNAESALAAIRGLRHQLAVLRALSCGSPFWHGHDSGLASARWAVLGSYPRSGVPPVVKRWEDHVAITAAVVAAAQVPDSSHIWWDARVRPLLGTVEVRVMDAQPCLDNVAGLVALTQGIARYAVERPVNNDLPTEVLAENDFRVARYGLETRITDVDGVLRPVRELALRAVVQARSVLRPDGLDASLAAVVRLLKEEPEYERQRRIRNVRGLRGLLRDLTERTHVSL